VHATMTGDGNVHVEQRYTFDSDDGGTVGIPDLAGLAAIIPGAANVTLDGAPANLSGGTFHPQLRVHHQRGTVAYDERGAVTRYQDIGVVELDVLPSPEGASRQDPDVAVTGTLTLPEGPPGTVEPHYHGGRDRAVSVSSNTITFSSKAPI